MTKPRNKVSLSEKINELYSKDTSAAYQVLQELEILSDITPELYQYLSEFIGMLGDDKYVIRCRGFRLICRQARWDEDNQIDRSIDQILSFLEDDKPTAVRQGLAALKYLVPYKPALHQLIRKRVQGIDPYRYRDTMQPLLVQDVADLLSTLDG